MDFVNGKEKIPTDQIGSVIDSLWGRASSEFAASLSGDITVVGTASGYNPYKVFAQVEVPALLANKNITSIGGHAAAEPRSAGPEAIASLFDGFTASVAKGAVFRVSAGTVALSREVYTALGFAAPAGSAAAEELAAQGLARVVVSVAANFSATVLGVAGGTALSFLATPIGGAIIDLLTSATPANAGEDKVLAQHLNTYSDIPTPGSGTSSRVQTNSDGGSTIDMPLGDGTKEGDHLNLKNSAEQWPDTDRR